MALLESDVRFRRAQRTAAAYDNPEDNAREAMERIRSGEDPFHVGRDLHERHPEAHALLERGTKGATQANLEAGRLFNEYHRNKADEDARYARLGGNTDIDDRRAFHDARDRAIASKHSLFNAAQRAGRQAHEFFGPRKGESGPSHRSRLLQVFGDAFESAPFNHRGREVHQAAVYHTDTNALNRGIAAVNHWYGDTHDIEHSESPIPNSRWYRVRKRETGATHPSDQTDS